jgi:hypothetical protein
VLSKPSRTQQPPQQQQRRSGVVPGAGSGLGGGVSAQRASGMGVMVGSPGSARRRSASRRSSLTSISRGGGTKAGGNGSSTASLLRRTAASPVTQLRGSARVSNGWSPVKQAGHTTAAVHTGVGKGARRPASGAAVHVSSRPITPLRAGAPADALGAGGGGDTPASPLDDLLSHVTRLLHDLARD